MCFETTYDSDYDYDSDSDSDSDSVASENQHSECPTFNKHRSAASQIRYQALSALAPF